ncbi:WD40-repeat-containing domain protein [Syncephalis fuscata]|nr:WD40-repeat-containing domain protein [Syncephalis fuscata]
MSIPSSQFNVALKEQKLQKQRLEQGDCPPLDDTTNTGLNSGGIVHSGEKPTSAPPHSADNTACEDVYAEEIARAYGVSLDQRILAFGAEPPSHERDDLRSIYNCPVKSPVAPKQTAQQRRRIATTAERKLDAPGIIDDYYLNLLDWSQHDILAVALDRVVYLWNSANGTVEELFEASEGDSIASTGKRMRTMRGHRTRVTSMAWNSHTLSSGCRDGSIWQHDVRIAQHKMAELLGHTSDVCGLAWHYGGEMLASGGNDNIVNLWDARSSAAPRYTKANHTAAVKALSWCPWQPNLLATGGGSNDRCINIWNSNNGALLSTLNTGSQVSGLFWSPHDKELLSTHGHPDNQLTIWNYPSMARVIDIPAHETRVLYSALSPDGQMLATAAADETLKIWRVFEASAKTVKTKLPGDKKAKNYKGIRVR